eukprot:104549_1
MSTETREKRSLIIDIDHSNDKKRRKLNNKNALSNSKHELSDEKKESNNSNLTYNCETTVALANRLQVPTYAHKIVFHQVNWIKYLNTKYNSSKYIQLEHIEPNKDAFILKNVLTKTECKTLIFLSESHGYCPIFSALNGKTNRTNTRMIINDKSLTNILFERIKIYLPNIYKVNGQTWQLVGLNERFRFCKYISNQQFKLHHDGRNGIKGQNIASFYTINIYLNNGNGNHFTGGNTIFYEYNKSNSNKNLKYKPSSFVTPESGLFLIFNHYPNHYKHSGDIIQNGTKYIARTEAMYKLIDGKNNWIHKKELRRKFKSHK